MERAQHHDERASEFLAELRYFSSRTTLSYYTHEESNAEDYLLAVRLLLGCKNDKARSRLLREEKVDLQKFLSIIEAEEAAETEKNKLQTTISGIENRAGGGSQYRQPSKTGGALQYGQPSYNKGKASGYFPESHKQQNMNTQNRSNTNCWNCGGDRHPMYDCPARNKTCNYCGRIGHLQRMCYIKNQDNNTNESLGTNSRNVSTVQKTKSRTRKWWATTTFHLDDGHTKDFPMFVDTGSGVTLMKERQYLSLTHKPQLKKPTQTLTNYNNTTIDGVLGTFTADITVCGRKTKVEVFVVPNGFTATLGRDAIRQLKLNIDGATGKVGTINTAKILRARPALTEGGRGEGRDSTQTKHTKLGSSPTRRCYTHKHKKTPSVKENTINKGLAPRQLKHNNKSYNKQKPWLQVTVPGRTGGEDTMPPTQLHKNKHDAIQNSATKQYKTKHKAGTDHRISTQKKDVRAKQNNNRDTMGKVNTKTTQRKDKQTHCPRNKPFGGRYNTCPDDYKTGLGITVSPWSAAAYKQTQLTRNKGECDRLPYTRRYRGGRGHTLGHNTHNYGGLHNQASGTLAYGGVLSCLDFGYERGKII